jgi:hypothetical protein
LTSFYSGEKNTKYKSELNFKEGCSFSLTKKIAKIINLTKVFFKFVLYIFQTYLNFVWGQFEGPFEIKNLNCDSDEEVNPAQQIIALGACTRYGGFGVIYECDMERNMWKTKYNNDDCTGGKINSVMANNNEKVYFNYAGVPSCGYRYSYDAEVCPPASNI